MPIDSAKINAALKAIFRNGSGEVGLEVGVDPGLAAVDYIQIPASMARKWAARIVDEPVSRARYDAWWKEKNEGQELPAGPIVKHEEYSAAAGQYGWFSEGDLTRLNGKVFWLTANGRIEVEGYVIEDLTVDHMRAFYTVNIGHLRGDSIAPQHHMWVHAVRFWAVVAGLVSVEKNSEYTVVPDPAAFDEEADTFVEFAFRYNSNAYTAAAARAGTWRKSNHCTGGAVASGFAKRWLEKEGYWSKSQEKTVRDREVAAATDAFYVATHAISNHGVLAAMAPDANGHWSVTNPAFGFLMKWDVLTSAKIRLTAPEQVAGGAMVADSVEVLKMVIQEGLAPLLNHADQADALAAALKQLRDGGVACAVYASWFLDGHPDLMKPTKFDQKDSTFSSLVGELACVATRYYKGLTISDSASLQAAATQLGSPTAMDTWSALASEKKNMTSSQVIRAYRVMKGGTTLSKINKLLSEDDDQISEAVAELNSETAALAEKFNIPNPHVLSAKAAIASKAAGKEEVATA